MNKIKTTILSFLILGYTNYALAAGNNTYIKNPLKNITDEQGLVKVILQLVVRVGSVVSVLFLIYSGFLFVKARGNSGELEKARSTFMWTIIGIAILLGAQVISTVVVGTVTGISK